MERKPMKGKYKTFEEEEFRQNNDPGIFAVLDHLNELGAYAEINDDRYGPDIVVYRGFIPVYYIEVDVVRGWKRGLDPWPFKNLHVPERKAKFINLRAKKSLEFWSLSADLTMAMIAQDHIVNSSPLKEVANSKISSGELFYCVDLENVHERELLRGDENK
jgi:hypothetical protein